MPHIDAASEAHRSASFGFAHAAQRLALPWLQNPLHYLPRVWHVILMTPECEDEEERAVVAFILYRIARAFVESGSRRRVFESKMWRGSTSAFHAARALRCIRREFSDHTLHLSRVAAGCGVSATYLSHLIRVESGYGFQVHVRGMRVLNAAFLLASRAFSVKEAAVMSGYARTAALDKDFRDWCHMTPGESDVTWHG